MRASLPKTANGIPEFLSGGGETGEMIRSIDWSNTPLGPVAGWPQSLRTAISICLNSKFPILIWWGPEYLMLYNDAYSPMPGDKHPNSLGAPGKEVWPEIWHIIGPMLESVYNGGLPTWSENQLLLLNRYGFPEECYFTFSYSPIYDESGGIGGIFTAVYETTETIISERHLRTLRDLGKYLSEMQSLADVYRNTLKVLSGNLHDFPFAAIYLVDEETGMANLTGTSNMQHAQIALPETIDLSQPDTWPAYMQRCVQTNQAVIVPNLIQVMGEMPSGAWSIPPQQAYLLPVSSATRKTPYAILVTGINPHTRITEEYRSFFRLITDQIATEIANVNAYIDEKKRVQALMDLDRSKTVFFSNISHEFRTPLTLVLGPIEDALHDPVTLPVNRERMGIAHRNVLRLLKLVNTLLDFSRIEAGRMKASFERADLCTLTKDLASTFRSAIEKAGLDLVVQCEPIPAPVYVDVSMWEKIVLNLISNAFKYTHKGSITISLQQQQHAVEFVVSDTGMGISEEELPRIFERFYRVHATAGRSQEGTGIGLALVQELVKLHEGSIDVQSQPGKGSAFTIRIPTGRAHLPADQVMEGEGKTSISSRAEMYLEEALRWLPSESIAGEIQGSGIEAINLARTKKVQGDKPHVLLVDDNADMRDYLSRLLQVAYEVTAVANGKQALRFIQKILPDLILTDVMMPELDGFELVKKIKSNPVTAQIPVILLSARAGEEATIEGLMTGADDYLTKPFSARELLSRIDSNIKLAQNRLSVSRQLEQEVEQRTRDLQRSNEALKRSNKELEQYAFVTSHDLQEPLRKIQIFLNLLYERNAATLDTRSIQHINKVLDAAKRMASLIDDLLEFSRLNKKEQFVPVDLNKVLEVVKNDYEILILEKEAVIQSDPLPVIDAIPLQINQLFGNLISNALKFSDAVRKPVVTINSKILEQDGISYCELLFRDNGIGFDPVYSEKIFEVFQRLNDRHHYDGTGIGLALCSRIVSNHNGFIHAHGEENKGATFRVILPLQHTL